MARQFLLTIAAIALACTVALANDPSLLQDFCVGVNDSVASVFVNGKICKDPNTVISQDFFFSSLNKHGNISNWLGLSVNQINFNKFPGLNTMGLSVARIDYAPEGINSPHSYPRASEFLPVVKGTLYVEFVTSDPVNSTEENKLFEKTLYLGFPITKRPHTFSDKYWDTNAIAFVGFSSHNPGRVTIENAIFKSNSHIPSHVLKKAFQDDSIVIKSPKEQFCWDEN